MTWSSRNKEGEHTMKRDSPLAMRTYYFAINWTGNVCSFCALAPALAGVPNYLLGTHTYLGEQAGVLALYWNYWSLISFPRSG